MNITKRLKSYWKRFVVNNIRQLYNTIYWLLLGSNNFIVVEGWLKQIGSKIVHRNLGDELNFYLLIELTGKRVIGHKEFFHRKITNYLVIGSVVEDCNEKSIIWGAGAFQKTTKSLSTKPEAVQAVRGPLTRRYLLENGVDCPPVYGDPALLLPLIYTPKECTKVKVGIIPHFNDLYSPHIKTIEETYKNCRLINLRNYNEWTDVIDTIANCDVILSSSLHGMIIADAYKIPNVWVKFSKRTYEGSFKYLDYFGGVGRKETTPVDLNKEEWQKGIEDALSSYKAIVFDKKALLESCPFDTVIK